jgi:cell division transport system ATP-binding protein
MAIFAVMGDAVVKIENGFIFQQNDSLVLHDVNLVINPGEFAYLIGKTGSGKSSLLKTLYGALPLREGQGFVDGFALHELARKDLPYLRRRLGIVFQDFQLLSDRSVLENLRFVLKATEWTDKAAINKRCQAVLDMVGLASKDYKMPHELSGGEQQRVVIARALINEPALILADEPTGNLDPDVSDDIMKLLNDICQKGTGVLMATHDYRLLNKFPGTVLKCAHQTISKEDNFIS